MEVLHAVHDAEYDKALPRIIIKPKSGNGRTTYRGTSTLFDPYAHQKYHLSLYTVVCTATTIPCAGPELVGIGFL